jgi:hypothetical protein
MSLKRAIGLIAILLVLFSIVVIGGLFIFSYILPEVLKSELVSGLEANTEISDFAFDVRELDLAGADFSNIRLGAEKTPALVIRSIQIDYSLQGLYQKKIKKVTASGVELYCVYQDGKLRLRGIDLENVIEKIQARMREAPATAGLLPVEQFIISNATVICEINDQTYRVPFEIEMIPQNSNFNRLTFTAHIYIWHQKVLVAADMDLRQKTISFNFSSKNLMLARFATLTQRIEGLNVSGQANMEGSAKLTWAPFTISSMVSLLELHKTRIRLKHLQLQNPLNSKQQELPLRIKLENVNETTWRLSASEMAGISPVPFTLSGMDSHISLTEGVLQSSGNFVINLNDVNVGHKASLPLKIFAQSLLRVNFSINYSKNGNLAFELKNRPLKKDLNQTITFIVDRYEIKTKVPELEISGYLRKKSGSATYQLKIPDVHIASQNTAIELPAVLLSGSADIDHRSNATQTVVFNLQIPHSGITLNSAKIGVSDLALSGTLLADKNSQRLANGRLQWTDANLALSDMNAKISGMRGAIPFQWPPTGMGETGNFDIKAIHYQHLHVGSLSGTIEQTTHGISFAGTHQNRLIPELSMAFKGETKIIDTNKADTHVHFQMAPPLVQTKIDLGKFHPSAKGIIYHGNLFLNGDVIFGNQGLAGSMQTQLTKGNVLFEKKKISIEGIQMALTIPDLANIRSAPKQPLSFERATMGGIEVNAGQIEFQIESRRSIFIEKGQFKWADGNVEAHAIRIAPGIEDYRLILYCDRVNLASVLQQFGAAQVEAQGELNGRIPLRYQNGKVRIADGFLFSTPGVPRKIRMTNTEVLTAGIPPGTPQHVQMELARKALEDYDYSWVKLNITSERDELVLKMQLDGKPAKPLPFVYRKDLGRFTKIEVGGQASIFQGIRLDINFRLPLNKLLQYKEILKMMQ